MDEELEDIKAACRESNKVTNPWAEILKRQNRPQLFAALSPPPSSSSGPASTLSSSTVRAAALVVSLPVQVGVPRAWRHKMQQLHCACKPSA